jgi:hypothetical protein
MPISFAICWVSLRFRRTRSLQFNAIEAAVLSVETCVGQALYSLFERLRNQFDV